MTLVCKIKPQRRTAVSWRAY